jgi:hypothetical protein
VRAVVGAALVGLLAMSCASAPDVTEGSTATTTTTAPAVACRSAGPAIPAVTHDRSDVTADLDGDGVADRLSVFALTAREGDLLVQDREWRVHAALGNGADVDVRGGPGLDLAPVLLGATDIDHDRRAEVWVDPRDYNTARGVTLVVLDGCVPRQVTGTETPARFLFGRGGNCCPGMQPGVGCVDVDADGRNEILETVYDDGTEVDGATGVVTHRPPTWRYRAWALTGARVRLVRDQAEQPSDPNIGASFAPGLRCETVSLERD